MLYGASVCSSVIPSLSYILMGYSVVWRSSYIAVGCSVVWSYGVCLHQLISHLCSLNFAKQLANSYRNKI